ncbi:MAG TPA: hypothetical protein VEM96_09100 [Pyrinomonadaceae bacterium]|nr:hypothetical protein [Pyrinomonadaceae bacterium]
MIPTKLDRVMFCALLCLVAVIGSAQLATAQDTSQTSRASTEARGDDETNMDTQLYLVLASNQPTANARMPALLDPVVRQLQATLPFKNYALAATLLNRVKNGGRLSVRWIGGPLAAPASSSSSTPSFNDFTIDAVQLGTAADGSHIVRLKGFNFGSRVPVQTGATVASTGNFSVPSISYEPTGLHTDISLNEGEPVVVGTLNIGPSGDVLVVVISVKRSPK